MRNFLLCVVLLNVLAYAYQRWIIEPDEPRQALDIEQDYPRLQVAQRAAPRPLDEVLEAVVGNAVPEVFRCLRIGPFASVEAASSVRIALVDSAAQVRQSEEAGDVWVGHWVQVVGQPNRAAAEVTRDQLVAAGLRDAYIVSADEPRVSLGVFRSLASADRTIEQATRLGLETRMDERYQPGTNYWLDARLAPNRGLDGIDLRGDSGQILRTETVSCGDFAL
jgi:hypothetical protein